VLPPHEPWEGLEVTGADVLQPVLVTFIVMINILLHRLKIGLWIGFQLPYSASSINPKYFTQWLQTTNQKRINAKALPTNGQSA
jgi:hypothetical protein